MGLWSASFSVLSDRLPQRAEYGRLPEWWRVGPPEGLATRIAVLKQPVRTVTPG